MSGELVFTDHRPVTVLLVEDDDGDAMAVERAFRKARIANPIVRAVDGIEALEVLRGTNGKQKLALPYIMLVDIAMPRMNGIELIREMRADPELEPSIAFILTTSKREEDMAAAYALNVAGYITKDKTGGDFLKLAGLIRGYWRLVELPVSP